MSIEKIKSVASTAVVTADSKLKDSLSFLSDLKEEGWEKINTAVNNILGLAPLIEVTGFSMKDVSVDATIPPSITLAFVKEKDVDQETIEKLLEENKDKEILTLIVKGLQKADSLQKGMKLSHYNFRGLSMKIGLPPDISLKFTKMEKQAQ
jgi:hypothetical protein